MVSLIPKISLCFKTPGNKEVSWLPDQQQVVIDGQSTHFMKIHKFGHNFTLYVTDKVAKEGHNANNVFLKVLRDARNAEVAKAVADFYKTEDDAEDGDLA